MSAIERIDDMCNQWQLPTYIMDLCVLEWQFYATSDHIINNLTLMCDACIILDDIVCEGVSH